MSAAAELRSAYENISREIKTQVKSRGVRASNELRNAAMIVLRGKGGGKQYRIPGTRRRYTASAPGSPPANRTGAYRMAWKPRVIMSGNQVRARIENPTMVGKYKLGRILDEGTKKMDARPHMDLIRDKALPKVRRIYAEPYF